MLTIWRIPLIVSLAIASVAASPQFVAAQGGGTYRGCIHAGDSKSIPVSISPQQAVVVSGYIGGCEMDCCSEANVMTVSLRAEAGAVPYRVTGLSGHDPFLVSLSANGMQGSCGNPATLLLEAAGSTALDTPYQIGLYRWGGPVNVGESAPAPPRVLQLGPNPALDHLALRFDLEREGEVQMRVLDVAGRVRTSQPAHALGLGTHRLDLALSGLEEMPPGYYIAEVVSRDRVMRRRFVRVR